VLSAVLPLYLDYRQGDAPDDGPGRGVFPLKLVYDFDPGVDAMDPAVKAHVLGLEANIWTELLRSEERVETAAFPRLAAVAEVGWTPADRRDWRDFLDRLPGQLSAYQRRGIHAADSALRVRLKVDQGLPGSAILALSTQARLGTLRFTLDGSPPQSGSRAYGLPLETALPVHLRAAAFRGDAILPGALDAVIPSPTGPEGFELRLSLCASGLALSLESQAGPVVQVDAKNPCWLTPAVAMDGVTGLRLSSVSLPYNFEQGADAAGMALDTQLGPGGVIEAHLDSCEGAVVASSPLDDPTQSVRQLTLLPLAPVTGRHVLCLQMRRSRPGPFWALERAALMMAEPMKNPPTP
jgi:hexosaminidase